MAVTGFIALAGCGSSKPAYCSDRTNLQNDIKGLTSLNVSSGVSGLEAQLKKVESSANAAVNSAKADFPNETSALKSSVDTLAAAAKGLPSNPSASQIAALTKDGANVVSAAKSFTDATKSKCQ
jgi:hypothetical protein